MSMHLNVGKNAFQYILKHSLGLRCVMNETCYSCLYHIHAISIINKNMNATLSFNLISDKFKYLTTVKLSQ